MLYTLPFWLIPLVVGIAIVAAGWVYQGSIVVCFGIIWGVGAFTRRCGRVTSQWSEKRWGLGLLDEDAVWWTLLGQAFAGVFGAGIVMTPITLAAISGAWPLLLLGIAAQVVVCLLAIGWGMSKVAAKQLEGLEPVTDLEAPETETVPESQPVSESKPTRSVQPASAPAPRRASPPAPAPSKSAAPSTSQSATPTERMQCPKCKGSDTTRGAVIGWYCNVCGWREQRIK